jgi:hypothetical protein
MAHAGRLLQREDWLASARRAMDYLLSTHLDGERLLATSRDGTARLNGYLDDYAYLIDALLELLQAQWDDAYLAQATALANYMIVHFEDPEHGGFFFTADNHETLVHRPKPLGDDAMPSGNGVAVEALQVLATLTGDGVLHTAAERALRAAWPAIERAPYAHVGLFEGLQYSIEPPETLVVRGPAAQMADWRSRLESDYRPGRSAFLIGDDASGLPPALAAKTAQPGTVVAYRCRGNQCEAPFSDPVQL